MLVNIEAQFRWPDATPKEDYGGCSHVFCYSNTQNGGRDWSITPKKKTARARRLAALTNIARTGISPCGFVLTKRAGDLRQPLNLMAHKTWESLG
jgi:hypothetical protein